MKIEPSFSTTTRVNFHNIDRASSPASPDYERSHTLLPDLAVAPDIRAEKVARGRAMVADPNYPSQEQIKGISRLLAAHWTRSA